MVRHGIRGAVIALACGSAVATAMGVLGRGTGNYGWRPSQNEISQRVKYQIDSQREALIPAVRGLPGTGVGLGAGQIGLPEFMTRDTSKVASTPAIAPAAASSAQVFHAAPKPISTPLVQGEFEAAVRGGEGGGFAYAYSKSALKTQDGLEVNLARPQGAPTNKSYGSDTPFSDNSAPRGGSAAARSLLPFSGEGVAQNLPQTTPGQTNSTANPAVASGPSGPTGVPTSTPVSAAGQVVGGATFASEAPTPDASTVAIPAPGAVGLLGAAGLMALRRRR